MAGNGNSVDSPLLAPRRWQRLLTSALQRAERSFQRRRRWEDRAAELRRELDKAEEERARAQKEHDAAVSQVLHLIERRPPGLSSGASAAPEQHLPGPALTEPSPEPRPTDEPHLAFFQTPPGAAWKELTMRFLDGHTVSVEARGVTGVFNYTQMGMVDPRSGDPTVQWELLRDFADDHGALYWGSGAARRRLRKRREKLARRLRAFFRIGGDPFRLTDDRRGWRTRFAISSEA